MWLVLVLFWGWLLVIKAVKHRKKRSLDANAYFHVLVGKIAEVYTGTAQWAKAKEYAKKVMDSSYKLNTTSVKYGRKHTCHLQNKARYPPYAPIRGGLPRFLPWLRVPQ